MSQSESKSNSRQTRGRKQGEMTIPTPGIDLSPELLRVGQLGQLPDSLDKVQQLGKELESSDPDARLLAAELLGRCEQWWARAVKVITCSSAWVDTDDRVRSRARMSVARLLQLKAYTEADSSTTVDDQKTDLQLSQNQKDGGSNEAGYKRSSIALAQLIDSEDPSFRLAARMGLDVLTSEKKHQAVEVSSTEIGQGFERVETNDAVPIFAASLLVERLHGSRAYEFRLNDKLYSIIIENVSDQKTNQIYFPSAGKPRLIDLLKNLATLSDIRQYLKESVAESSEDLSYALYEWVQAQELSNLQRKKDIAELINLIGTLTGEGVFTKGVPCYVAAAKGGGGPTGRFYLTQPRSKKQIAAKTHFEDLPPLAFNQQKALQLKSVENWADFVRINQDPSSRFKPK